MPLVCGAENPPRMGGMDAAGCVQGRRPWCRGVAVLRCSTTSCQTGMDAGLAAPRKRLKRNTHGVLAVCIIAESAVCAGTPAQMRPDRNERFYYGKTVRLEGSWV